MHCEGERTREGGRESDSILGINRVRVEHLNCYGIALHILCVWIPFRLFQWMFMLNALHINCYSVVTIDRVNRSYLLLFSCSTITSSLLHARTQFRRNKFMEFVETTILIINIKYTLFCASLLMLPRRSGQIKGRKKNRINKKTESGKQRQISHQDETWFSI